MAAQESALALLAPLRAVHLAPERRLLRACCPTRRQRSLADGMLAAEEALPAAAALQLPPDYPAPAEAACPAALPQEWRPLRRQAAASVLREGQEAVAAAQLGCKLAAAGQDS